MVGRYKYNKKLSLWARIRGQKLSFPVADPRTGEIMFDAGHIVTDEEAREMDAIGVNDVTIEVDGRTMRVFSNHMVDLDRFVDFDPVAECGIKERVRESVLKELLEQYSGEELKEAIRDNADRARPQAHSGRRYPRLHQLHELRWRTASAIRTISTTSATAVCAAWASCCRTSSASAFPVWSASSASA